ncbi:MAG TPA: hypothetical protein VIK72_17155 [Clostridiaceae bacterium]
MRKILYFILFSCILTIVVVGFISISYKLPNTIKNRSYFQVEYKDNPFLLSIKTDEYIIDVSPDIPYKVYKTVKVSLNNTCNDIFIFFKQKLDKL